MSTERTKDTLENRLAQCNSILNSLLVDDHFATVSSKTLAGTIWAAQTMAEQAMDAFQVVYRQRTGGS